MRNRKSVSNVCPECGSRLRKRKKVGLICPQCGNTFPSELGWIVPQDREGENWNGAIDNAEKLVENGAPI